MLLGLCHSHTWSCWSICDTFVMQQIENNVWKDGLKVCGSRGGYSLGKDIPLLGRHQGPIPLLAQKLFVAHKLSIAHPIRPSIPILQPIECPPPNVATTEGVVTPWPRHCALFLTWFIDLLQQHTALQTITAEIRANVASTRDRANNSAFSVISASYWKRTSEWIVQLRKFDMLHTVVFYLMPMKLGWGWYLDITKVYSLKNSLSKSAKPVPGA